MGRIPHCSKDGLNRGAWTALEDKMLTDYISIHGEGKWSNVAKKTGLKRCGKSCRLRWLNYLRPDIKRGNISHDEEELIIRLHKLLGNRWSLIAGRLPGRTDNEIKNYWNSNLAKKAQDFELVLPKLSRQQLARPSSSAAQKQAEDPKLEDNRIETQPQWPCGEENAEADFLIDFNMEEFCEILDPAAAACTKNISDNSVVREGELDLNTNESKSEEVAEFQAAKYWDGNECVESEMGGSEFMSIVSFLDSGEDWCGMASLNTNNIQPLSN